MDDVCESKKPGKEGQECSKKRHGDDNVASTAHLATVDRILTVCRGHSRYTACGPKCFDPRGLVSTSLLDGLFLHVGIPESDIPTEPNEL